MSGDNKKKSFLVHFDKRKSIESLIEIGESGAESYDRIGRLFVSLMDYAERGGTEIVLDDMTRMAYYMLSEQISQDTKKYNEIKEKRREAINKRWREQEENDTKVYKCIQPIQKYTNDTDTVTDTVTDNTTTTILSMSPARACVREAIPTITEIATEFKDVYDMSMAESMSEAQRFYDFNQARAWDCLPHWRVAAARWNEQKITQEVKSDKWRY